MDKYAYIVLEGIDGSGTTTHTRLLAEHLGRIGYCVRIVEEPSKGPIGGIIRGFLSGVLDAFNQKLLALLFAADRLLLAMDLEKKLSPGCIIVSDRSWVSSLVYQTYDGFPDYSEFEWVYSLNKYALRPHIVVYLDVDPVIAYERLKYRAERELPEQLTYLRDLARRYSEVIKVVKRLVPVVLEIKIRERDEDVYKVAKKIFVSSYAALRYLELSGRLQLYYVGSTRTE